VKKVKPTTIEQAVEVIVGSMNEEDQKELFESPLSEISQRHHSWGMGIRNEFNLWTNKELLTDCGSPSMHADDASGVIMEAVWYHLQGQPVSNARKEVDRPEKKVQLDKAIENLYYKVRCKRPGIKDNDQNIFQWLSVFFGMSFKEYKKLAKELDIKKPVEKKPNN